MTSADAKLLADSNLETIATICRVAFRNDPHTRWREMFGAAYIDALKRLRHYDPARSKVHTFLNAMIPELRRLRYGRSNNHAHRQKMNERRIGDAFDVADPRGDITYARAEINDSAARVRRTLAAYKGGAFMVEHAEGFTQAEIAARHGLSPCRVSQLVAEAREAVAGMAV